MSYEEIFAREPGRFGTPSDPKPWGLATLAVDGGRDAWNQWRTDNPAPIVQWRTSENNQVVDLRNLPNIDFSGFEFGDGADFSGQFLYGDRATSFDNARFGNNANFTGVRFPSGATFRHANFGAGARLANLKITIGQAARNNEGWVVFDDAIFGDDSLVGMDAPVTEAPGWTPEFSMRRCVFGDEAHFHFDIPLQSEVQIMLFRFDGALFGENAYFFDCNFSSSVFFRDCCFGKRVSFDDMQVATADFSRSKFGPGARLRRGSFSASSFAGTVFEGAVDFSNRKFLGRTYFRGTHFSVVPLFHGCEIHPDTEFDEDSFPKRAEGTDEASRAYRTLKLAMSAHQAIRQEQFFFRQEMHEERLYLRRAGGTFRWWRSVLYGAYGLLSGYGSSVMRPLFLLALTWLLTAAALATLYGESIAWLHNGNPDWQQTFAWLTYCAINGLPIGGFETTLSKLQGMLPPPPNAMMPWVAICLTAQKVLSLLFIFLIGLALRNAFKMK